MLSSRTILKNLRNLNTYLSQYHQSQQSTYFEKLIAESFSRILYLPFYTIDNDDTTVSYRVTWQGKDNPISKASQGKQDTTAYCYDFCLIIEATLKTGANQWSKEFAQSIRHCEEFVKVNRIQQNKVYIILVTPELHHDTYRSIHSHPKGEYRFIPIEISTVAKILETSIFAFTMRHLELRQLLNQISECIKTTSSLDDFRDAIDNLLANWQKEVLQTEKSAVIGVKSYEIMRRIDRLHIGVSEISGKLQRHPTINKYLKIISDKLSFDIIEKSLIQQSLAFQLSQTYDGEKLFSPVPFEDFKERELKLIKTVKEIK
ncbi:MAG: AlwI family type II restriction endonuclease [Candidatus Omnitrophota bacterium]